MSNSRLAALQNMVSAENARRLRGEAIARGDDPPPVLTLPPGGETERTYHTIESRAWIRFLTAYANALDIDFGAFFDIRAWNAESDDTPLPCLFAERYPLERSIVEVHNIRRQPDLTWMGIIRNTTLSSHLIALAVATRNATRAYAGRRYFGQMALTQIHATIERELNWFRTLDDRVEPSMKLPPSINVKLPEPLKLPPDLDKLRGYPLPMRTMGVMMRDIVGVPLQLDGTDPIAFQGLFAAAVTDALTRIQYQLTTIGRAQMSLDEIAMNCQATPARWMYLTALAGMLYLLDRYASRVHALQIRDTVGLMNTDVAYIVSQFQTI